MSQRNEECYSCPDNQMPNPPITVMERKVFALDRKDLERVCYGKTHTMLHHYGPQDIFQGQKPTVCNPSLDLSIGLGAAGSVPGRLVLREGSKTARGSHSTKFCVACQAVPTDLQSPRWGCTGKPHPRVHSSTRGQAPRGLVSCHPWPGPKRKALGSSFPLPILVLTFLVLCLFPLNLCSVINKHPTSHSPDDILFKATRNSPTRFCQP